MDKNKEENFGEQKYGLADLLHLGTGALQLCQSDDV